MASNLYIKSLFWLISFGGAGYGLLLLTEPSEAKLTKIRSTTAGVHLSEEEKRKVLFLQKLKSATENTPVYLKNEGKEN